MIRIAERERSHPSASKWRASLRFAKSGLLNLPGERGSAQLPTAWRSDRPYAAHKSFKRFHVSLPIRIAYRIR